MRKQKNKKYFYSIVIILLIIISIIFILKNTTKKTRIGNNMNSQEIVDYILSINSYKATLNMQVNSNKNTNKYILKQEYNTENGCVQEVIEPSNIAGVKIIKKDDSLTIKNSNLDLSTIFTNYKGLSENGLDLYDFINDYKLNQNSSFEECGNEIILKTQGENKYYKEKILYINKEGIIPTKLIIKDDNQKTTIIIEYNDIELN